MTNQQKELARHALGLPNSQRTSYRNHFVTGDGSDDYADWMAMVQAGEARRRNGNALTGGDDLFLLTTQGAKAALNRYERLDREDFPVLNGDT